MPQTTTLKELKVGSRFILAKDLSKREPIYEVIGMVVFNAGHGSATRECRNTKTKKRESKSCRLSVIKLPIEQKEANNGN